MVYGSVALTVTLHLGHLRLKHHKILRYLPAVIKFPPSCSSRTPFSWSQLFCLVGVSQHRAPPKAIGTSDPSSSFFFVVESTEFSSHLIQVVHSLAQFPGAGTTSVGTATGIEGGYRTGVGNRHPRVAKQPAGGVHGGVFCWDVGQGLCRCCLGSGVSVAAELYK